MGAVLLLLLIAVPSLAAERPAYEQSLVSAALARHGWKRDPSPEGKPVKWIAIDSSDVVSPEDPYPDLLNAFHIKTRPRTIRRELLLKVGEPYRASLAAESERNLRGLFIFTVSRVVAVQAPGGVGVLVVTKDLWSLRLNSEYSLVGSLLQLLHLHPTEQNFLGLNKRVSLDFLLKLDTVSLGEEYDDPRVLGQDFAFSESASLIINRHTRDLEGSQGGFSLGRPLYTLEDTFAWSASASWRVQPVRTFRGASVWQLPYPNASAPVAMLPDIYNAREADVALNATRSWGSDFKLNLTGGLGAYAHHYAAPASENLTAAEQTWLTANYFPRSENAVYLSGSLQAFEPRYAVLAGLETFGTSEDYRLGFSGVLNLNWAEPGLLSPVRFIEAGVSLRYRLLAADDLFTAELAGGGRWEPNLPADAGVQGPWVNRRVAFELSNYTPPLWIGRVVARALVDVKSHDLAHAPLFIGGAEGLRGTEPESQSGRKVLLFNLEYRTRPWIFHSIHLGLVAFWDAGSAFDDRPSIVHTVGIGLRGVLPQFNRIPFRIDIGWVLNGAQPPFGDRLSSSYGQVTDFRPAFLDSPI